MKRGGPHLAALTTFSKVKEPGLRGWQVTLPERVGVVHAVRSYESIEPMMSPLFLEFPPDYQRALCGAKVKVILPTSFATAGDAACAHCDNHVRVDLFKGVPRWNTYFGDPWDSFARRR